MRDNRDAIMEVLSFDCGTRPTTDFYTVNSLYGSEYGIDDSTIEVNHYSQYYQDINLINLPTYGLYRFYYHSGLNRIRFTPCDTFDARLLERFAIRNREDTLRLACTKYGVLGTYLIIDDESVTIYE